MKTFKRYTAALEAAGEQDIIEVRIRGESLYIVPGEGYCEAVEEISILKHVPPRKIGDFQIRARRERAGYVTPKHLKRLGNANWAVTK